MYTAPLSVLTEKGPEKLNGHGQSFLMMGSAMDLSSLPTSRHLFALLFFCYLASEAWGSLILLPYFDLANDQLNTTQTHFLLCRSEASRLEWKRLRAEAPGVYIDLFGCTRCCIFDGSRPDGGYEQACQQTKNSSSTRPNFIYIHLR